MGHFTFAVNGDIILLLSHGGKTGLDILLEIKKRNINCPFILITGYPSIDTATEAIRLGAFDYIQKPINKDKLFHSIDAALQHKTEIDDKEKLNGCLQRVTREKVQFNHVY